MVKISEKRETELKNLIGKTSLPCRFCKGTGKVERSWEKDGFGTCSFCKGRGCYENPIQNLEGICRKITGGRKETLKKSFPSDESESYFLWRNARFHGGKDVTMPVIANLHHEYNPFVSLLDYISEIIAEECFGTSLGATCAWGRVLSGKSFYPDFKKVEKLSAEELQERILLQIKKMEEN